MKSQSILYQEITTNTWPSKTIVFLNSWILRLAEGITNRCNSVLPLRYSGENLLSDISKTEEIFEKQGLIPTFQLSGYYEPPNLKKTLVSLGYKSLGETRVISANIDKIPEITCNINYDYLLEIDHSKSWFAALDSLRPEKKERNEGTRKIINRITIPKKGFFRVEKEGKTVSMGLAVIDRGFMTMYNLFTDEDYRRQGLANSMIMKMIDWGKENSVKNIFLSVEEENHGAINLYEKLGMKECYRYIYMKKIVK